MAKIPTKGTGLPEHTIRVCILSGSVYVLSGSICVLGGSPTLSGYDPTGTVKRFVYVDGDNRMHIIDDSPELAYDDAIDAKYVHLKKRTESGKKILAETISAGATVTSDWVDCEGYFTKTIGALLTVSGSITLEVCMLAVGEDPQKYYEDALSANTFTTKSFSETMKAFRIKIWASANGSLAVWYRMQV